LKKYNHILTLFVTLTLFGAAACNAPVATPAEVGEQRPAVSETDADVPSAQPDGGSAGLDACLLLTKADAEAILGQPVSEPERPVEGSATFDVSSCKYKVQGESAYENVFLIVTVPVNGDLQSAQIAFDTDKNSSKDMLGADPVDVPGLGDTAYWVAGYGNQLSILKGNVHVILSATNQTGESAPQPILDLANVILGRLP